MLLADGTREEGKQYQVFLLSGPEDRDTIRLAQPITNDTLTASGRPWAWTMGQRYVSLAGLTRRGDCDQRPGRPMTDWPWVSDAGGSGWIVARRATGSLLFESCSRRSLGRRPGR